MAALATVPSKPKPNLPPGYHDPASAAERLCVGERWLRDGANHHGFPHGRLGKWLVFSDADLAEIYAMHRVPAHTVIRGRRRAA
jgi:hypothetical protein